MEAKWQNNGKIKLMIIVGTPQDFDIRYYPDAFEPPLRTLR